MEATQKTQKCLIILCLVDEFVISWFLIEKTCSLSCEIIYGALSFRYFYNSKISY